MINLIIADLRRILKKKGYYFMLLFMIIIAFFVCVSGSDLSVQDHIGRLHAFFQFVPIIFGSIPIYLGVFGDEMRTGSIQCVIGRGVSRAKVIVAKLIDCLVLTLIYYGVLLLVLYLLNYLCDIALSPRQNIMLAVFVALSVLQAMACYAFSTIFLFTFWSVAAGIMSYLIFGTILGLLLQQAQNAVHLPFYDAFINGLLENAYAAIDVGSFPFTLIPAILVYIVLVTIIAVLLFKRKELDL